VIAAPPRGVASTVEGYAGIDHEFEPRTVDTVLRVLDVALSSGALVVSAPVLVACGIAVRLSGRPVLYRGARVGRFGRQFTMYKFRTLVPGAEQRLGKHLGEELTRLTEAELTAVGRTLRRSKLDELPQLWNVVRGDMSLVGPRPSTPQESDLMDPRARRRQDVKPGMTGLWQVSGRSRLGYDEMIDLDLQYTRDWSPFDDLRILARTPFAVFRRETA